MTLEETSDPDVAVRRATQLVLDLVEGRLGMETFVARYDSFYWRFGLHGEEGTDLRWLDRFQKAAQFHRDVDGVLGRLLMNASEEEARHAGGVSSMAARTRIAELVLEHDAAALAAEPERP